MKRRIEEHTYTNEQNTEQDAIWTPEETIDVKKRRLFLSEKRPIALPAHNASLIPLGGNNSSSSSRSARECRLEEKQPRCVEQSLKERMDVLLQDDISLDSTKSSDRLDRFKDTNKTEGFGNKKSNKPVVLVPYKHGKSVQKGFSEDSQTDSTPAVVDWWRSEKNCAIIFDAVLLQARKHGHEFDLLCALSRTCKSIASIYALSPSVSLDLSKRYIDAYMRERITVRKFEMENTPTKLSLEPYYQFREEKDEQLSSWAGGETEEDRHWWRTTFTLTAPCISVCWKGIDGIPPVSVSRSCSAAWAEHCDESVQWERVKTKNWSIRNPLVRLAAIHAQAHASCKHAQRMSAWLAQIKKNWLLAKQRKAWKEHADWHENPILHVTLPQSGI